MRSFRTRRRRAAFKRISLFKIVITFFERENTPTMTSIFRRGFIIDTIYQLGRGVAERGIFKKHLQLYALRNFVYTRLPGRR